MMSRGSPRFSPPQERRRSPSFTPSRTTGSGSRSTHRISRSSPNGTSPNGAIVRQRLLDSPSRKLIDEFMCLMIDRNHEHHARLDKWESEREVVHREALEKDAEQHAIIRRTAEMVLERTRLEQEAELRRKEEEAREALERERRRREDAEHAQRLKEMELQEEERKRAVAQQQEVAEAQRKADAQKAKEAADEQKRQAEKAEAERKAREATAAEEAKKAATPVPAAAPVQPVQQTTTVAPTTAAPTVATAAATATQANTKTPLTSAVSEREGLHNEYLAVHKRLKELRKQCMAFSKQNKNIGEWRRSLTKTAGQFTSNNKENAPKRAAVMEIFRQALAENGQPMVDVRQYVTSASPISASQAPCNMPILLIYFMHLFCKKIGGLFVAGSEKQIDPLMIQAAYIFSEPNYLYNGHSLIDIFLAKFHKVCPVLFGIYGPENTAAGRLRIGWKQVGGQSVNEAENTVRLEGYAAGFASLSLRDFSGIQSKRTNPLPNTEYWRALSIIINTPAQELTKSHCIVLKAMTRQYPERFIRIYGQMAEVALHHVVYEFPKKMTKYPDLVREVQSMEDTWRKELRFTV